MTPPRDSLFVHTLPSYEPTIGRDLWRLQEGRERTLEVARNLSENVLDRETAGSRNTTGTLLYHLAAIEADWLYTEVLETPFPEPILALFPFDVRDASGRLTPVKGVSLEAHLARLEVVRQWLLSAFQGLTLEDYRRARTLPDYDVTPEWVLHHLLQHEALHRGQILSQQ